MIVIIIVSIIMIIFAIVQIERNHKNNNSQNQYMSSFKRNDLLNASQTTDQPLIPQRSIKLNEKTTNNHVEINPDLITFEESKMIMIGSEHSSCKSVYDCNRFFSSAFECLLKGIPRVSIQIEEEKNIRQLCASIPIKSFKSLTKQTVLNSYRSFVSVDLETTGLDPDKQEIIEIAAIKFVDFSPVEMFHTYIKPNKHIPKRASDINHITDDMVADAPHFSQISNQLQEFINGFHLIAYNAQFDMNFLHTSGIDLNKHKSRVYDVLDIARKRIKPNDNDIFEYPSDFKLSTVCQTRNIGSDSFHSASSDALACALLFIDIVKKLNEVENAFALIDEKQKKNGINPFYLDSYTGERF